MKVHRVRGLIDRRILVNYRVDPERLATVLPPPFKPKLIHGSGIAGICLIRLRHVRPRWAPLFLGLSSENAAHRIAVEWEEDGELREGVFITRRDSSSRLNSLLGGSLFPGVYHYARFQVAESDERYRVAVESDDGKTRLAIDAGVTDTFPSSSCFGSLQEASDFFRAGSIGYSPSGRSGTFEKIELVCDDWQVEPLAVQHQEYSFFSEARCFPAGSWTFDCALLMLQVAHEWVGGEPLCCSAGRDRS